MKQRFKARVACSTGVLAMVSFIAICAGAGASADTGSGVSSSNKSSSSTVNSLRRRPPIRASRS